MNPTNPILTRLYHKKIWNDAVIATLREVRKYDGIMSNDDIEYLTKSVMAKVGKKLTHNFKSLNTYQ